MRWPALGCMFAGAALFQFFGNANRGYIDTASLFYWWGFQWINPASEGEHAWLILAIAAWLLVRNLRASRLGVWSSESGVGAGAAAMIAGLALHALGFVAQQARLSILALLVFTWGGLRLAGGPRWGRAAVFPLAFLVFAIPFDALDSVGFWLRVWVVDASTAIAQAAGIGVLRSGTQLLAPDGRYNYDVAAACSGIRSLTALAALSLLAGYLNFHTFRRRALVFLLCFPFVYLGNVARITAIIFAAAAGGPRWGDIAHEVMGYGVFLIVLGGVLGATALLRRWWPETAGPAVPNRPAYPAPGAPTVTANPGPLRRAGPTAVAAITVAVAIGEMFFLHHLATAPPRGQAGVVLAPDGLNPVELPAFIGTEWIGRRAEVTPIEREILPPDTGFSRRNYVAIAAERREVFLSIVLSGRDRTSIHRPELCLVGQGWTVTGTAAHRFVHPARPDAAFPATLLRVRREVPTPRGKVLVPQLVAYWFVGGDAVVATHWERFLRDSWNRVVHARADRWAYVLVQTDATDGEAAALARVQAVLDGTLPTFQRVFATR